MSDQFKILKKDPKTQARTGVLITPHGKILTPAYTIVATHAEIKCLKPRDIAGTGTQVVISNTYHLWNEINARRQALSAKRSFLIQKLGTNIPTMTDSGGFQVFSLGFGKENKVGKILKNDANLQMYANQQIKIRTSHVRITDRGVFFNIDGQRRFLSPELSMEIQKKLGADIIFAFDECTSPLDNLAYNKKALERTHRWAKICLEQIAKRPAQNAKQLLFGIVQGGRFADLRAQSAKFIGSLPFDGFGIGGSFGKEEMVKTLKIVMPYLPEEKPRHLLGIGRIQNVFDAVENGVDLFDCVIPTREARHGRIYRQTGHYDIRKTIYANDNRPLDANCKCPACKKGVIKSKLHKLFKSGTPFLGQRYATIHNIWFFNNLMKNIRTSIARGSYLKFKNKFLAQV